MQGQQLFNHVHHGYKSSGDTRERLRRVSLVASAGRSSARRGSPPQESAADGGGERGVSPRRRARRRAQQPPGVPLVPAAVFARVRPLAVSGGHAEAGKGEREAKRLVGHSAQSVTIGGGGGSSTYDFPRAVLSAEARQQEVYDTVARDLVAQFHDGYNVLLWAYGQSGTGKTHTLLGPAHSLRTPDHAEHGLFPRACAATFAAMGGRAGVEWSVHASAIEFYMMGAHDLLMDDFTPVTIGTDHRPAGLETARLRTMEDVLPFLRRVQRNRTRCTTQMSDDGGDGSSRSHAALILTLRQLDITAGTYTKTRMNFVDLAGAERPGKAGTERMSALDALIMAVEGRETPGAQGAVINYELSMLRTHVVMRNAFGAFQSGHQMVTPFVQYLIACTTGQALLSAVVCLSPASQNGWESWFACTVGEDFSKLRAAVLPETPHNAVQFALAVVKRADEAEAKLRAASQIGPGAKFYPRRLVEAQELRSEAESFSALMQQQQRRRQQQQQQLQLDLAK
jgi:hypothetical protein